MTEQRVLIVDDDEFFLSFEKSFLERDEFRIDTADSGETALAMMRENPPDLVLLDLYMPAMDGDEVARTMRDDATLADIPIIMVSQETNPEVINRCIELGIDEFVTKPINIADLMNKAGRLIHAPPRLHPRVPVRLKISYKHLDDFMGGTAHNISLSGVYVRSRQDLPLGAKVELELCPAEESPEAPNLIVTGEVVRQDSGHENDEHGHGIRFVNLDADSRRLLNSLVRQEKARQRVDVLIVEDDRLPRTLMDDTLSDAGYRVASVENGFAALKQLDVYHPRLVITDIVMPRLDGIDFAQAIRNNMTTREIPFIFASSKTDPETVARAKELGASYFIAKPIVPDILLERVRKILPRPGVDAEDAA